MDMHTINFLKDYGGLIIGLIFLLAAVAVLPGRIKYYVLTAGIAVIGYEAWVRSQNRKLLAEADAEREALRNKVKELNEKGEALEQTVSSLNKQLDTLNKKKAELDQQSAKLAGQGDAANAEREAIAQSSQKVMDDTNALLDQIKGQKSALDFLQQANMAYSEVERMGKQEN